MQLGNAAKTPLAAARLASHPRIARRAFAAEPVLFAGACAERGAARDTILAGDAICTGVGVEALLIRGANVVFAGTLAGVRERARRDADLIDLVGGFASAKLNKKSHRVFGQ